MRVSRETLPPYAYKKRSPVDAEEGMIYCVSACWYVKRANYHAIDFVGFPPYYNPSGSRRGFLAANFRKVEEIQLCVKAAEMMRTGKPKEVIAQL